jgi:aerobic-type carbon monoxide dehydrogenase small subunit (CoxS/CutS family)
MASGVRSWRLTRHRSMPRGLFCGIGTCFECLVDVNGESSVRACMRSVADGDDVRTSRSVGAAPTPAGGADVL